MLPHPPLPVHCFLVHCSLILELSSLRAIPLYTSYTLRTQLRFPSQLFSLTHLQICFSGMVIRFSNRRSYIHLFLFIHFLTSAFFPWVINPCWNGVWDMSKKLFVLVWFACLGRGNLNWRVDPIRLSCGHVLGTFSGLLIDARVGWMEAHCGWSQPWADGPRLLRKVATQVYK